MDTNTWGVRYRDIMYKMLKIIVADALSRLILNGNQDTTHMFNYKKEIVPEINDIK